MNNNFHYLFKFILIGETNVGKSAILLQFVYQRFQNEYDATIGVEFGSKLITVKNKIIKLQIWDTAGQESFRSITRSYYKGSIAALLVYDVGNRSTFENVSKWLAETRTYSNEKIFILLIGNKKDLDRREVSFDEGLKLAEINGLQFIETSAKTGENIEQAFGIATANVLRKIELGEINPLSDTFGIKLGNHYASLEKRGGLKNGKEDKGLVLRNKNCCCKEG